MYINVIKQIKWKNYSQNESSVKMTQKGIECEKLLTKGIKWENDSEKGIE